MGKTINWLDWTCIAIYAAGLLGIALYNARKIQRQDDVFLAGRKMSRWPVAISMYMALFSTNTFLGMTGWLNRPTGTIWIGLNVVGMLLAVPFVVWLYPTLFYRLRITSAYEYLDRRFSTSVRRVATVFFIGSRVMWMATMLYSSSLVVSRMVGWNSKYGSAAGQLRAIVLIGGLGTSFALLGGMHAVIWTDVAQFFVLVAGLALMIVLGVTSAGGAGEVIRSGLEAGKFAPPEVFSLTDDLSVAAALLLGFFGYLANAGADQVVLQQYLAASSDREAKASLWRNGLFLKPMSLIYPVLGLILFTFYRAHPEVASLMRIPDDALPVYVVNVFPSGAAGLMIVAMMAAVLTSIESGLAALSAAIQVDYIKRRKRPLTDRQGVFAARLLLLACGIFIMGMALWVRTLGEKNNIIQILNIVMYPFSGVLLGIFLMGILVHRVNARGALAGGVAGFLLTVAVPLSKVLLPASAQAGMLGTLGRISNFYYAFIGTMATMAVGYAASFLWKEPEEEQIRGLTRWSMPEPLEAGPLVEERHATHS